MWPFTKKRELTAEELWRKGSRLLQRERAREAIKILKQAAKKEPMRLDGRLNLGVAHYMLGQYAEAIPHLKYVLAIDNDHLLALLNLGACYDGLGELDQSIDCLEKVCRSRPSFPDAHYNLAIAYMKKSLVEKAESAFREELRLNPANELARRALNDLYVRFPRGGRPKQTT